MKSQKAFEKDPVKFDGTPDKPAAPHTWRRIDPEINKIADRIRMASRPKQQGFANMDPDKRRELAVKGGVAAAANRKPK